MTGFDISGIESSTSCTLVLVAHSCLYNNILFDSFMGLKYARTDLIHEPVWNPSWSEWKPKSAVLKLMLSTDTGILQQRFT
jgi:hypothetical protein